MERQKWEYKLVPSNLITIDIMQDKLNQLGKEGWELVAVSPTGAYTFKRPLISLSINSENLNNNVSDKDAIRKQIEMYQ